MHRLCLIIGLATIAFAIAIVGNSPATAGGEVTTPADTPIKRNNLSGQTTPAPVVEGCITCHGQIEPMHKYGPTEVYESLKDGKDAVGLSCTSCHGGNPTVRKSGNDAHRH